MTQPKQRIDVFISSTSIDLLEYRAAVTAAILTLGLYPSGMETWATQDESSVELCRRKVDDAELFVGIYAYRYGWCPPGYDGKSITELEYDWATERGIPRLCFVMSDDHGFPESRKETDAEAQAKLKAFKARVKERTVGFFTTPDDLKARVTASLAELVKLIHAELATPRCNFVPKPEHFVGRVDEIKHLRESLQTGGAITAITALKGIGGIGKTTLAQAYAHLDERFKLKLYASLGQHYRENMEPMVMEGWIGSDFHFPPNKSLEDMIAYTRQHLSANGCGSPCLLVIDDVWIETVEAARRLRQAAPPDTRVLITTRSEDVAAALDADSRLLDALKPDEGAALILDLIRDSRAADCHADLESISRLLGGHSLALVLAARQLRRNFQTRRVKELLEALDKGLRAGDPFPDLKLERADAASKLDSVTLTLKLTLDALRTDDPDLHEKRLKQFRALGALPPGLAFHARHAFAIWEEDDSGALDDFAAEGLITPNEARDDWYTQHRLLRAYARALLRHGNELEQSEQDHWDYIFDILEQAIGGRSPQEWKDIDDDAEQVGALGQELLAELIGSSNLDEQDVQLQAMLFSGNLQIEVPRRIVKACFDYCATSFAYHVFSRSLQGRRLLWAGLVCSRELDIDRKQQLTLWEGLAHWHRLPGEKTERRRYVRMALELRLSDVEAGSLAENQLKIGEAWLELGESFKAVEHFQRALDIASNTNDLDCQILAYKSMGELWLQQGEIEKATKHFEQALGLSQQTANLNTQASCLVSLGEIQIEQGNSETGIELLYRALDIAKESGRWIAQAKIHFTIATTLQQSSDPEDASNALINYVQAYQMYQKFGDAEGEIFALAGIAGVVHEHEAEIEAEGDMTLMLMLAAKSRALEAGIDLDKVVESVKRSPDHLG